MRKIIIIAPFYNAAEYIGFCVASLRAQTHKDFLAYFIDDMSTDNSCEVFEKYVNMDSRFTLVKNVEKSYAIQNIYKCINSLQLNPEDIIVQLDGDDWLANPEVLQTVINTYEQSKCWVTYGSYINASNLQRGLFSQPLPDFVHERNNIRQIPWMTSHLKTFIVGLFQKISVSDFQDAEGNWLKTTHDLALMFPLIEMAGQRSKFISEILYVYNDISTLNDFKQHSESLLSVDSYLRNKTPYSPLINL